MWIFLVTQEIVYNQTSQLDPHRNGPKGILSFAICFPCFIIWNIPYVRADIDASKINQGTNCHPIHAPIAAMSFTSPQPNPV